MRSESSERSADGEVLAERGPSVAALTRDLTEPSAAVRERAARALAEAGATQPWAHAALERAAASDPEAGVRQAAEAALEALRRAGLAAAPTPEGAPSSCSVFGQGTVLTGKLVNVGSVQIDGRAQGEVHATQELTIGPTAAVEADLHARHVVVHGRVRGTIYAAQRCELGATAHVSGKLVAPALVIHEGAVFDGTCKMEARDGSADVASIGLAAQAREPVAPREHDAHGSAVATVA